MISLIRHLSKTVTMSGGKKIDEVSSLFEGKVTKSVTNLVIGAPGPETLTLTSKIFAKASEHCFSQQGIEPLFQYGPRPGNEIYLKSLAKLLSDEYQDKVDPYSLVLTCGASHGLHLVASSLLKAGEAIVFVENPTYFIALDMIQGDLGLQARPIPMQSDGLDLEHLEQELIKLQPKNNTEDGKFWAMLYIIPTYHNPTGILYSVEKCKKICELASKYGVLVLCDDVYNMLHYENGPPPRLLSFDNPESGNVISNGTFSKILGPGVRIGWLEVSKKMYLKICNTGILKSGGSVNNAMSGLVASAIDLGLQSDHLKHLREEYAKRMRVMCDILQDGLPVRFEVERPKGGYFVWIRGPPGFDSEQFAITCLGKYKVQFLPGQRATSIQNKDDSNLVEKCGNCLRLSIAFYDCEQIKQGCLQLCEALRNEK